MRYHDIEGRLELNPAAFLFASYLVFQEHQMSWRNIACLIRTYEIAFLTCASCQLVLRSGRNTLGSAGSHLPKPRNCEPATCIGCLFAASRTAA